MFAEGNKNEEYLSDMTILQARIRSVLNTQPVSLDLLCLRFKTD